MLQLMYNYDRTNQDCNKGKYEKIPKVKFSYLSQCRKQWLSAAKTYNTDEFSNPVTLKKYIISFIAMEGHIPTQIYIKIVN